jgi:hypothetical protein
MHDDLTAKKGFRSRKPDAMTNVERQRKWRRKNGGRGVNFYMAPEIAASVIYLSNQWGMQSTQEVIEASLRFLTICTRHGLTRLPQTMDDDD